VVEFGLTTEAGEIQGSGGKTLKSIKSTSFQDALFMTWTGRMWLITDDRAVIK
jgi:hypothetical protein